MVTMLRAGENIVKEGPANLHKNIEAVGGKLILTNQRLIFEGHKFNIQSGVTEIELTTVQSLRACWTLFLGVLPTFPNSLAVYTEQGKEYRFVLFRRHAWAAAIEAHRHKLNTE